MDSAIAACEQDPDAPFADAGAALKRLKEMGLNPADLAPVARFLAYEAVFGVRQILDEANATDGSDRCPGWKLMEVGDDGGLTGRRIGGLHESVLGADPSGREGRPA